MKNIFKKRAKKQDAPLQFNLNGNPIRDCEDPDTCYIETHDGLRLVFRKGEYVGWYTTELAEPLN